MWQDRLAESKTSVGRKDPEDRAAAVGGQSRPLSLSLIPSPGRPDRALSRSRTMMSVEPESDALAARQPRDKVWPAVLATLAKRISRQQLDTAFES